MFQLGVIACGVLLPAMYVLGAIFAALWFTGIWLARKLGARTRPLGGLTPLAGKLIPDPVKQGKGNNVAAHPHLVKPDRPPQIIGDVISRIERKGLKVIALEMRTIETETAHSHYAEHA